MGHDLHFLERVQRVSRGHADLAMSLYRRPELVREIFSRVDLPASAERVAISLEDPVDGPFVLVQRTGHFVSCLGPGMRTDGLPVISRAKLDSVAAQLDRLKECLEIARAVTDGRREPDLLPFWEKALNAPEALSREDVAGLIAFQDTLGPLMMDVIMDGRRRIDRARIAVQASRAPANRERATLELLTGRRALAMGVFGQLLLARPRQLAALVEHIPDGFAGAAKIIASNLFLMRSSWLAVSAINGIARGGKAHLPWLKGLPPTFVRSSGLVAVGGAHPKVRAEVQKALGRPTPENAWMHELLAIWDESRAGALDVGRGTARRLFSEVDVAGLRFSTNAEVPDHVAAASLLGSDQLINNDDVLAAVITGIPLASTVPPEDLYLPAPMMNAFPALDPAAFFRRYVEHHAHIHPKVPVRVARAPGPNEPCVCGSGRKQKKCCGRDAAPRTADSGG